MEWKNRTIGVVEYITLVCYASSVIAIGITSFFGLEHSMTPRPSNVVTVRPQDGFEMVRGNNKGVVRFIDDPPHGSLDLVIENYHGGRVLTPDKEGFDFYRGIYDGLGLKFRDGLYHGGRV